MRYVILAASLLLAACFLVPGKFASTLDVQKDGHFAFSYKGEIAILNAGELMGGGRAVDFKSDPNAPCYGPVPSRATPGAAAGFVPPPGPAPIITTQTVPPPSFIPSGPSNQRKCTPDEITQRTAQEAKMAANAKAERDRQSKQMAQLIGVDPSDEASMRSFATTLQKQRGWRSVTYKGGGVFDVDYAENGVLDRDFVFPVFPRVDVILPFVIVRKRADGAVLVTAPGYRNAPLQSLLDGARARTAQATPGSPAPDGSFTITTDVAPLTNNTEDGPATVNGRTTLTWRVIKGSDRVPETLLALPR